jgi:hypothetical protein
LCNDYVLLYTDINLVCAGNTFYCIQISILYVEWLRFTIYRSKSCMWSDYVLLYTDMSCEWNDYLLLYTDISVVCGVTTFYYIQIYILCVEWLRFTVYRYKSCVWSDYALLYRDVSLVCDIYLYIVKRRHSTYKIYICIQ